MAGHRTFVQQNEVQQRGEYLSQSAVIVMAAITIYSHVYPHPLKCIMPNYLSGLACEPLRVESQVTATETIAKLVVGLKEEQLCRAVRYLGGPDNRDNFHPLLTYLHEKISTHGITFATRTIAHDTHSPGVASEPEYYYSSLMLLPLFILDTDQVCQGLQLLLIPSSCSVMLCYMLGNLGSTQRKRKQNVSIRMILSMVCSTIHPS